METLLILSCVLIILAIPFGIKESIAVKKVRIEKTACSRCRQRTP